MGEKDRSCVQLTEGPATQESRIVTANGDFLLTIRLADSDRIGCLVDTLAVTAESGAKLSLEPARCARTLSYLEGGLSVVEVERSGKRATLRSAMPVTGGGLIRFVEVTIDPVKGLSLGQYVYNEATGERKRVLAAMTRETLARLSEDLTRLLAS